MAVVGVVLFWSWGYAHARTALELRTGEAITGLETGNNGERIRVDEHNTKAAVFCWLEDWVRRAVIGEPDVGNAAPRGYSRTQRIEEVEAYFIPAQYHFDAMGTRTCDLSPMRSIDHRVLSL